jgi:glycosyltransferase involved in cell wall biosynthesis
LNSELAIIVPAYKCDYLDRTLASIRRQTNQQFCLYVFDDCSPNPIESIAREALANSGLTWTYFRFPSNLGGTQLIQHFSRCIQATDEKWIWLFSDDDVMEPECVANFWETFPHILGDVRCFDSIEIDSTDKVISLHPPLPDYESWKHHAYHIFRGCRFVPQQAVVFSRDAYLKIGGFVPFPLGWASDFATTLALGAQNGIARIPSSKILFRTSGQNISSAHDRKASSLKLTATRQFIQWFLTWSSRCPDPAFSLSDEQLKREAFGWFKRQLIAFHFWLSPKDFIETLIFLHGAFGESRTKAFFRLARLYVSMAGYSARLALRR